MPRRALLPIIRENVKPDSIVYTDTFRSYNSLYLYKIKHYSINHSNLFAKTINHIDGIENFGVKQRDIGGEI